MSTSSSDGNGNDGKPRGGAVGNVFQRALESRPNVAARGAGEGGGERIDVPTCPNCGAPREREREDERAAQPGPARCRYCGERM